MADPVNELHEKVEKRLKAAMDTVHDLCNRRREWIMSIPARPDHDPDLVIAASLADVPPLLTENKELRAERDRLRAENRNLAEVFQVREDWNYCHLVDVREGRLLVRCDTCRKEHLL